MEDDRGCPPRIGQAAPAVAREYVRHVGTDWDSDVLESALLATSELVTNATLYGGDVWTLDVHTSNGVIRVEVYDSGRTPPAWLGPAGRLPGAAAAVCADRDLSLGGRGLHIVDSLSDRWGVTEQSPGKTVWFEMSRQERRTPSTAS